MQLGRDGLLGGAKTMTAARNPISADDVVEHGLTTQLIKIENVLDADCLTYVGPIIYGADDSIRDSIEQINNKKKKLAFILETTGGYAEVARRIADLCRHHYKEVDFIIPNHAMSAGTILAMSGDSIYMDYFSVMGPIDPQVQGREGRLVPALGYLMRYQDLLDKANSGKITTAEMNILMSFDQGELYAYEQARDLSVYLLQEWLVKYKFKNWTKTQTKKKPVTNRMKRARSRTIAKKLNDIKRWNSHGIGISMKVLREEIDLIIDDVEGTPVLKEVLRNYHKILIDYMSKMRQTSVVHTRIGYEPLG